MRPFEVHASILHTATNRPNGGSAPCPRLRPGVPARDPSCSGATLSRNLLAVHSDRHVAIQPNFDILMMPADLQPPHTLNAPGHHYQGRIERGAWINAMRSVLKFSVALVIVFVFFLIWDRDEINYYRAVAYNNSGLGLAAKGNLDSAITDYDKAISLDPENASFYINRGNAYDSKGDLDSAISDYSEAIRSRPKFATAYFYRANAYSMRHDFDRAISDYTEVIRQYPKYVPGYANRGRAFLFKGSLARAHADFEQALQHDPKDAYAALWLDLTERRDNLPSDLLEHATQLDMTAWPAPVVKLFLRGLSADALFAAAADAKPNIARGQFARLISILRSWQRSSIGKKRRCCFSDAL